MTLKIALQERALVLVKSFDKSSILKGTDQLYFETRQLLRDIFRQSAQPVNSQSATASIRLLEVNGGFTYFQINFTQEIFESYFQRVQKLVHTNLRETHLRADHIIYRKSFQR
jgi:hypothetical protein